MFIKISQYSLVFALLAQNAQASSNLINENFDKKICKPNTIRSSKNPPSFEDFKNLGFTPKQIERLQENKQFTQNQNILTEEEKNHRINIRQKEAQARQIIIDRCGQEIYALLNAGLSLVDNYLEQAFEDQDLNWTYNNLYYYLETKLATKSKPKPKSKRRKKLNTKPKIVKTSSINDEIVVKDNKKQDTGQRIKTYEVFRHRIIFELSYIKNLFLFWKKVTFPKDTLDSYNPENDFSLNLQINEFSSKLKSNYEECLQENFFSEEAHKNEHNYREGLKNIFEDFMRRETPQINPFTLKPLQNKNVSNELFTQLTDIFKTKDYYGNVTNDFFTKTQTILATFDNYLIYKKGKLSLKEFLNNINSNYKEIEDFKFPINASENLTFKYSPLDFKILTKPVSVAPVILSEIQQNQQEILQSKHVQDTDSSENTHETDSDDSSRFMKDKIEEETLITATEIVISKVDKKAQEEDKENQPKYTQDYFSSKHLKHQNRKKNIENLVQPVKVLSDYENELYSFLKNNIFTHSGPKMTAGDLTKNLKALKFSVNNKAGKGSVHYVKPCDDNPLFGQGTKHYKSFISIHLPHKETEIIPFPFYKYIKSGYANVFGLTRDKVQDAK